MEESIEKINSDEYEISFGSTTYKANLPFQKVLRACIYGKKTVQTLPGSVFSRDTFYRVGTFAEGTRSGEDLEWRNRAKKKDISIYTHQKAKLILLSLHNHHRFPVETEASILLFALAYKHRHALNHD